VRPPKLVAGPKGQKDLKATDPGGDPCRETLRLRGSHPARAVRPPATIGLGRSFRAGPAAARSVIVDFLDIGQGDSVLIRSPEGKTALIDAGPSRTRHSGPAQGITAQTS
jgi:hypothetical protein